MTEKDADVLRRIAAVRQRTISLYKILAESVDAESIGFVVREPGQRDVTLALIELGLTVQPELTRGILRQVMDNDAEVVGLTSDLVHE